MLSYEYKCDNCDHEFEIDQSITDKPKKKCPECKKYKLQRLISGGMCAFVNGEPTTVGQLADRNYKMNKTRIRENEAKKAELNPKDSGPWWNTTNEKKKKIAKMNNEQKHKYIMEGD